LSWDRVCGEFSGNLTPMKRWLNQYTARTVPGYVNILGEATNTATVSVLTEAGVFPASRHGDYWRAEVAVSNAVPLWVALTNLAVLNQGTNADLIATNRGHLLVPQTPETFTYDADGNLTSDSLWTNTWNAENRRTVIESRPSVPAAARMRVQWTHLPDGRWIERIVSTNSGTAYQPAFTNRYVWDGNVLLAVLNHTNGLELSFLRGLDLSGTPQGAGGVGGVLAVRVGPALPCGPLTNTTHFVAYDGNGNVAALVNAADGTASARYEYGPFGEPIRVTGPASRADPFRFSTKRTDDTTDLVLYEYRAYSPSLGRWVSRDPIAERGGRNLYGVVANIPTSRADLLGLGCFVTFNCQLYSETAQGKCDKHCEYVCVEKDRQTVKGLSPVTCDDLPPQKITITEGITAWGSLLCRITGGMCGKKGECLARIPTYRLYDDIEMPNRNCSRKDCIGSCEAAYELAKAACDKMQEPARTSCKAVAEAARALCIDTCNAWCTEP